ncbi:MULTISPECIES: hypothetical protein [Methanobacterium]|uniref:Uncharacterized protein n=1 Tax=Methanobacterium bryantii TaxID=2161 RepID=A0A2A2H3L5_METBR|nr:MULTISPECIES: hypothetical protein [Methanobacterium]OEC86098.1 hypothetical protein A9507_11635 [Methanobacterium sp. A39]PAV03914.1 hypothetical protein ASJ80_02535 [Methanobacterium bryantii]
MNPKAYIIITAFISGFLILGLGINTIESMLFDQIPYNYTSYISMPPNHPNESHIGGYYKIYGKGRDFNFHIVLPGAENQESPLDYTADGLNGTGKINNISITYGTLVSLLSGDFKNALFNTKLSGNYSMACAAWTGHGNFTTNGQNFLGNFKINGIKTDWEGTFNLVPENNRMALKADYIWYHHANKNDGSIRVVKKTYYM